MKNQNFDKVFSMIGNDVNRPDFLLFYLAKNAFIARWTKSRHFQEGVNRPGHNIVPFIHT